MDFYDPYEEDIYAELFRWQNKLYPGKSISGTIPKTASRQEKK